MGIALKLVINVLYINTSAKSAYKPAKLSTKQDFKTVNEPDFTIEFSKAIKSHGRLDFSDMYHFVNNTSHCTGSFECLKNVVSITNTSFYNTKVFQQYSELRRDFWWRLCINTARPTTTREEGVFSVISYSLYRLCSHFWQHTLATNFRISSFFR